MEGHKRLAGIGLELAGDVTVELAQLADEGRRIALVPRCTARIRLHQAIADRLHLPHGPQGVEPDVGIHRAMGVAMPMVVIVAIGIGSLLARSLRRQGGHAAAGIDHHQLGIAGRRHPLGEEALHRQAVLHQHPGLPQRRQIARLGLKIVGAAVGGDQGGDRGAGAGHRSGEQGDRKEGGDHAQTPPPAPRALRRWRCATGR